MSTSKEVRKVLVTTQYRGVFFGHLSPDQDINARTLTLTNVRNAMYWSGKLGFLGLAANGPESGSRIGAVAPCEVTLHDVTSVSICTPIAAKTWEEFE